MENNNLVSLNEEFYIRSERTYNLLVISFSNLKKEYFNNGLDNRIFTVNIIIVYFLLVFALSGLEFLRIVKS